MKIMYEELQRIGREAEVSGHELAQCCFEQGITIVIFKLPD
jgi:hypothetical protein